MPPPQFVQFWVSAGKFKFEKALHWIQRQRRLHSGHCIYCNNLDPRGHEDTLTIGYKGLNLFLSYCLLARGEIRGCNFCSLI